MAVKIAGVLIMARVKLPLCYVAEKYIRTQWRMDGEHIFIPYVF